jgi:hypothetical protein
MSDYNPNLTDKISETITNAFKKTKVFEKIGKIEIYIGSFIVVSTIISLTNIYMHYCNMDKIKRLEDKLEGTENVLKHNIEINRLDNASRHHKIVKHIKDGNLISVDAEKKIIEKIMDIKLMLQNSKKDLVSESTSMTAFSPFKSIDSIDGWREHIIKQEDVKEMEDDELLNECYDSIPLNNLKKKTGSWLI